MFDSPNTWERRTKENSCENSRKDSLTHVGYTPYDDVMSITVGSGFGVLQILASGGFCCNTQEVHHA